MRLMGVYLLWSVGLIVGPLSAIAQEKKVEPVSFAKQVAPIFVKKCLACHGERQPESGYQLHTYEKMLQPGDMGEPVVTPGKPEESLLVKLVASNKKEVWMPKEGDRLAEEQIGLIRRWVAEGAKFDGPNKAAAIASLVPPEYDPPPEAYPRPVPITALAFHPQGIELAVGGYNEITVWNPADGKLLRRIRNVAQRTYGLAYSPDGKLLAAASGTPASVGEVKLFEANTGNPVRLLGTMADVAYDVAFSPKGDKLAACAADRSIRIFDVASGKQERVIEDHADWVMAIAWNHDGTRLASASRDKTSKVFDVKTGESQVTYNGHGQTVFGVAFSAEMAGFGHDVYRILRVGDQVYSCSADKTARQFSVANRAQVRAYQPHGDWVFSLAFHAPSKRLATGTFTGEVHIWNEADGKQLLSFIAAPGYKK
jgi:mono/diheme cytochrome c family protein